jgi:uncharacterized protein (TIGR03083 family)
MDMTAPNERTELDAALGAWALDALDPGERDAIDDALATDDAAASAAAPLRAVAATMGEPLATAAPAALREQVFAAATARRAVGQPGPGAPEPASPVEVYAAQVQRLRDAFATVTDADWDAPVAAYGWPLATVATHVLEVERYFASVLDTPERPGAVPADHLRLGTADAHEPGAHARRDPAGAVAEWSALAVAVVERLRSGAAGDLERDSAFHGIPMRVSSLLVVRGFELWTHADDVRRAVGQPLTQPSPAELHTMADRAVRGLPGLLLLSGIEPDPVPARIVLTGAGGGTWDVDLDLAADPDAPVDRPGVTTLVADVVDYCRLASRRLTVAELDPIIEGDAALAGQLLVAAQAIAF